jgi:hypothetical protein
MVRAMGTQLLSIRIDLDEPLGQPGSAVPLGDGS